jgi:tetratricopeptide (TPR) repeat protein
MSNENIEDTTPTRIPQASQPEEEQLARKPKIWLIVLLGILAIILLGGIGGLLGYYNAMELINSRKAEAVTYNATTQYQLGLDDLQNKRYEVARSRFEYVIELDPEFPGAKDKLAEVMLQIAMVKTPTTAATPTMAFTATPDTRGEEEIFNQAWQYYTAKDWDNTINTLDALRDKNLTYRAIEVDGMFYIALRYRGIDKIVNQGSLEPGMYDLALAQNFAPLDSEAVSFRNWARYYMTGASFWELDWPKVLEYFSEISASLPNMRDGSGWTAMERYRIALKSYADQLAKAGSYCDARDYYSQSLAVGLDSSLVPTATAAQNQCAPAVTETPTPGPTVEVPTTIVVAPTTGSTEASTVAPATAEPTTAPATQTTDTSGGGTEGDSGTDSGE